jgi:hypothetical protein
MHPSFAPSRTLSASVAASPVLERRSKAEILAADPTLSIRIDDSNPDHHLWRNRGTWWIHYTEHRGSRKHRCRHSLHTRDLAEARARRDAFFRSRGISLAASVPSWSVVDAGSVALHRVGDVAEQDRAGSSGAPRVPSLPDHRVVGTRSARTSLPSTWFCSVKGGVA